MAVGNFLAGVLAVRRKPSGFVRKQTSLYRSWDSLRRTAFDFCLFFLGSQPPDISATGAPLQKRDEQFGELFAVEDHAGEDRVEETSQRFGRQAVLQGGGGKLGGLLLVLEPLVAGADVGDIPLARDSCALIRTTPLRGVARIQCSTGLKVRNRPRPAAVDRSQSPRQAPIRAPHGCTNRPRGTGRSGSQGKPSKRRRGPNVTTCAAGVS